MKKILALVSATLLCTTLINGNATQPSPEERNQSVMNEQPEYLFKILSLDLWNASQNRPFLILSTEDQAFIHLATQDQLDKIIEKYWPNAPHYVVLKVRTKALEGKLALESNPGGTTKYYHLYTGKIPFESITEAKIIYKSPRSIK